MTYKLQIKILKKINKEEIVMVDSKYNEEEMENVLKMVKKLMRSFKKTQYRKFGETRRRRKFCSKRAYGFKRTC